MFTFPASSRSAFAPMNVMANRSGAWTGVKVDGQWHTTLQNLAIPTVTTTKDTEPWFAQLGLAIDDPAYFQAYARTLNHQRVHAIGPDGRVKSRWSNTAGDAMPGTYDAHGYYECQWGWLMDSQPSYAINVAELFERSTLSRPLTLGRRGGNPRRPRPRSELSATRGAA